MLRRQSEKAEFWRWVLVEFEQSGLSVRAFCQQEGISEPSFYAWRKKIALRDEGSPQALPSLLPVRVVSAPVGKAGSASADNVDSVCLSDHTAEVSAHRLPLNSLPTAKPASPTADPIPWSQIEVTTPSGLIVRIGQACGLDLIERTLLAIDTVSHHRLREAAAC